MHASSPSWPCRAGWFVASLCMAGVCNAEATAPSRLPPWHAGIELRPGYAVHPLRVGAGAAWGPFEARLVLDPLAFVDGIHDLDLSGAYWLGDSGYSFWAGWRPTTVFLSDGATWQHSVLTGMLARLPTLGLAAFRALVGFELSVMVVQHGGGLPPEVNCFCDGLTLSETLGFAALLRLEYAPPG